MFGIASGQHAVQTKNRRRRNNTKHQDREHEAINCSSCMRVVSSTVGAGRVGQLKTARPHSLAPLPSAEPSHI